MQPCVLPQLPYDVSNLSCLVSLDLSHSFAHFPFHLAPLTTLTTLQELTCSW